MKGHEDQLDRDRREGCPKPWCSQDPQKPDLNLQRRNRKDVESKAPQTTPVQDGNIGRQSFSSIRAIMIVRLFHAKGRVSHTKWNRNICEAHGMLIVESTTGDD